MNEIESVASDENLVQAYYDGDDNAFDSLYDRYASRLHRFFMKNGCDSEQGADRTQETWCRVCRTKKCGVRFDPHRARFSVWLFKIAWSVLLEKPPQLEKRFEDQISISEAGEEIRASENCMGRTRQPDEEAAFRDCFLQLSVMNRVIFYLRSKAFLGFTGGEVATILDMTDPQVSLAYTEARDQLRACMQD